MGRKLRKCGTIPTNFELLYVRDGGRCYWCGTATPLDATKDADDEPTVDHVIPRSRGGCNKLTNLVLSCRACNARKGSRLVNPHTGRPISAVLAAFLVDARDQWRRGKLKL